MNLSCKRYIFALLLLAASTLVGCESEVAGGSNGVPEIVISTTKFNVGGKGGGYVMDYQIKNGVKGVLPEVECLSDWVDIEDITTMQICFNVQANDKMEERTTRIKVSYEGAKDSHVVFITQREMVLDIFTIDTPELTPDKFTVRWTPKSDDIVYIPNIISTDYFIMSGVDSAEGLITEEFKYFLSVAQNAGLTLEETLTRTQKIVSGTTSITYSGLMPGSKYLAYCYGVALDGNDYEITAPLHYMVVNIPMQELSNAQFDITTTQLDSANVRINIEPKTWNGYYAVQVVPASSMYYTEPGTSLGTSTIKAMHTTFFNQAKNSLMTNNDIEQYLTISCYKGHKSLSMSLAPEEYMVAVFGVSSNDGGIPMMRTTPVVAYFSL